jgi:AcrR family transcriptional regulator
MSRPARVSRQDWLDLGRQVLTADGPSAMTLDRLTRAAGATKGSFYHHFDGMPSFVDALLDAWFQDATEAILNELATTAPELRRARLTALAYGVDAALERGIRDLAERDPHIAERIEQVDALRERTIADLVQADFGTDAEEAAVLGRLLNTLFVGVLHRGPADPHAFAADLLRWVERALADRRR